MGEELICKELLWEPLSDEIDMERIWNLLRGVSRMYKVSIEVSFNTKKRTIKVRVCGLRTPVALNFLKNIEENLGFKEARRRKKGEMLLKGILRIFSNDEICLGEECLSGIPYCVDKKELLSHVLIVGSTGSGKTTTTIHILDNLREVRRLRIVVLDWHGEYVEKVKANVIEPCIPRYIDSDNVNVLLDSIVSSVEMSATHHYLFSKVVNMLAAERKKISLDDVIYKLKSVEETARWVKESKYAILRRLEQLRSNLKSCDANYLLSKLNVIDLSKLQDTFVKIYVSNFILAWLRVVNRKMGKIKTIVVVEEAHNIAPRTYEGHSVLDTIVREERKWGLYAYIITQSPTSISREIVKNTHVKIIHGIREVDDAKFIAQSIGEEKLWREFIRLGRGQFFVSTSSKPVCVRLHLLSSSSARSIQSTSSP